MNRFIENLDLSANGTWLPIIVGVIVLGFMLFMPKRLRWTEIYLTFGVVGFVTFFMDIAVMAGFFDVFDLGKPAVVGVGDIISYSVIPSCIAIIFLNYYQKDKKWMYVGLFTLLSFLFEWGLVQVGFMELKGWKTWWSIPVYIFVFGFWLPWHFNLIRKLNVIGEEKYRVEKKIDVGRIFRLKEKGKP